MEIGHFGGGGQQGQHIPAALGMTASLGRSAPTACMAQSRDTISSRAGVLEKSWLEQTTLTPWAWAWAISPGSESPAGKNSTSSRSAQPLSQTS